LSFVIGVGDLLTPGLILEVPFHGFSQAGFQVLLRGPSQFGLNFVVVNGISTIMTGTIFDEGDQGFMGIMGRLRS
jgi:hypothetical protein